MTSLTSEQVFAAIGLLEQGFPVAEWRAGDIDLWPSYRFRLYGNAMNKVFANAAPSSVGRLRSLARRFSRAVLRVPLAALRDRRANARSCPGMTAVFLSDGVSFVRVGDTWVDRVMDPVIEELSARGLSSLKLTPLAEAHVPRLVPSRFVQPYIDLIKMRASRAPGAMLTPRFEELRAAAQGILGDVAPTLQWLSMEAARLAALAKWFGHTLKYSGARYAFVNTYYSLEGLAFTLAARRNGIRSIDLQHGIQGPHHVAYGRWTGLPRGGYSTLPDEFWVWGESEAANISAWSAANAVHLPRVTGNFWMQRWRDARDSAVQRYAAEARALRSADTAVRHVLACLTWGVPDEENTRLIDAARLCGPGTRWWWRLHPTQAHRRDAFAREVAARGLDASQVGLATDLPFYSMVQAADVVVAHSSTVLSEAREFGKAAVVTSHYGAELHRKLIDDGDMTLAVDLPDIAAAVLSAAPHSSGAKVDGLRTSLATVIGDTFGVEKP